MLTMTDEDDFDYDRAAALYRARHTVLMQMVRNVTDPTNFVPRWNG